MGPGWAQCHRDGYRAHVAWPLPSGSSTLMWRFSNFLTVTRQKKYISVQPETKIHETRLIFLLCMMDSDIFYSSFFYWKRKRATCNPWNWSHDPRLMVSDQKFEISDQREGSKGKVIWKKASAMVGSREAGRSFRLGFGDLGRASQRKWHSSWALNDAVMLGI